MSLPTIFVPSMGLNCAACLVQGRLQMYGPGRCIQAYILEVSSRNLLVILVSRRSHVRYTA